MAQMSLTTPKAIPCPQLPPGYTAVLSPTGRSMIPTPYPFTPTYNGASMGYGGQFSPLQSTFIGFTPPRAHLSPNFIGDRLSGAYNPTQVVWDDIGSPSRDQFGPVSAELSRLGSQTATPNGRRQSTIRVSSRSPYNNATGHHNVVDIARIQEGSDVRTTVNCYLLLIFIQKI
jgi:hypothetical protein